MIKEYLTSDLPEATYLTTKGISLVGLKSQDGKRIIFVFKGNSEEIEKFRFEFINDGMVSAQKYQNVYRQLKRKAYDFQGESKSETSRT